MFVDDNANMDGFGTTLAVGALKAIAFLCDIITFPAYVLIQQPWKKRALSRRIKAEIVKVERQPENTDVSVEITETSNGGSATKPAKSQAAKVSSDATSITYQSLEKPSKPTITMVRNNIDTMEKMFTYVSKVHANHRCLGTRQILAEEDEVQSNGRVFKKYNMGEYRWKTVAEVNALAENFGKGIRQLGYNPKENVAVFAETREEWMIAAHGLFKQNIPIVTLYATLGDEAIAHGINETEVRLVITSHDLLPKFKHILNLTPNVETIIYMEDQLKPTPTTGFKEGIKIIPYSDIIKNGESVKIETNPPGPKDTAIIMYTSGSTGVPKGVILSHSNLLACVKAFCDAVEVNENDTMLGFLPLAHVFELLVETVCLFTGVPIGYSTPLTLLDMSSKIKKGTKGDATVLRPTCLTAVPLILDRISKGIQEKVSKGSAVTKIIFKFAYEYKLKWTKRGYDTPLLNKLVFGQVRNMLGGRTRLVLSGGAPLSPDTHEQMKVCLCVSVIQGYGLTETCSCATVMDRDDMTVGRVGQTTTACDMKIVDWEEGKYRVTDKPYPRGEIIIGGDNISEGYYKLPGKTAEDFFDADGKRWFKTGDIGEIHDDGVLKIIDRKKDLVKLQAGEYVSLGKVEAELKTCSIVENICVYGDSSKQYTVALLVPNHKQLEELAAKNGVPEMSFEELCANAIIEKAVLKELAEHGKKCKLAKYELPAAVKLCTEVWSPDMGLVTAAFKLKRKDIQERYQHEINRMYAS